VPLGEHYLIALRGADPTRLNDAALLRQALLTFCAAVQLTVLAEAVHRFTPQGVTAVLVLAESHVALHTWPEHGQAAVDLFSCRPQGPVVTEAITQLGAAVGATAVSVQVIPR